MTMDKTYCDNVVVTSYISSPSLPNCAVGCSLLDSKYWDTLPSSFSSLLPLQKLFKMPPKPSSTLWANSIVDPLAVDIASSIVSERRFRIKRERMIDRTLLADVESTSWGENLRLTRPREKRVMMHPWTIWRWDMRSWRCRGILTPLLATERTSIITMKMFIRSKVLQPCLLGTATSRRLDMCPTQTECCLV